MFGVKEILRPPLAEERRRIDDQHLAGTRRCFALAQHQNARRQPRAVEEVEGRTEHRLDQVHLQQLAPNLPLDAATEERALWRHDRHAPRHRCHRLDHVLNEGIVAAAVRGQPGKGETVGVVLP